MYNKYFSRQLNCRSPPALSSAKMQFPAEAGRLNALFLTRFLTLYCTSQSQLSKKNNSKRKSLAVGNKTIHSTIDLNVMKYLVILL